MTYEEAEDLVFDKELAYEKAKDKAWLKYHDARSKIDRAYGKAMKKIWDKLQATKKKESAK